MRSNIFQTHAMIPMPQTPKQQSYDVVIGGGAILGSSVAWFTSNNSDFNGSILVVERDLRPAITQRKVTNGFRSMWAAQGDCAVRTVVDTQKLSGNSAFQTICRTIA